MTVTCDCCGRDVDECDTEEVDLVPVCMDCVHCYGEYEDTREGAGNIAG